MILSDVSIKQPVFATMMMVTLVVLGGLAYTRLAIDEYPDVTYPTVMVQTSYPGSSPEVMERDVSRPIEEALNTVQGLDEISSSSSDGSSIVRLQLKLGVNVMEAQQDVQSQVSRIRRTLPQNIEDPIIRRFDPNQSPIMSVAMQSAEQPIRELTSLAEQSVTQRLQSVTGVAAVNVEGGETRVIRVELQPSALQAYSISPSQVMDALARENQDAPAGRVEADGMEHMVRVTGRLIEPRAFNDIVVTVRNGVPVRIRDLGTVIDGSADKRSAAFLNDKPTVSLDILKISGANTVEVADSVRATLAELQEILPGDIRLQVVSDDSQAIRESLHEVQRDLLLGAILTIFIVYLFLKSWRSTVITGLTLPVSIISAFFGMWIFGFTINTMTLLALSLSIGLLIDDAIVVRENIVRHIEMGKDHVLASKEGTNEIGLAVLATTLAVVAVFIPVAFMDGIIGKLFLQFGVTVAFAVMISLFVSFTLDPMLSSVWPDPHDSHADEGRKPRNIIHRATVAFNDWFDRIASKYPSWLERALNHRLLVISSAAASLVIAVIILGRLGFTWMPDADSDNFRITLRTAPGSSLDYTTDRTNQVLDIISAMPEVDFTYTTIGGGFRGSPNRGRIVVQLKKIPNGRPLHVLQNELRQEMRNIPGVTPVILGSSSIFGGRRQPISIRVRGPEETRLRLAANEVLETIQRVPGVAEPNSSDEGEIPQLDIEVNRQRAWAAGVGIESIASTVQPLFQGQRASRWEDRNGYSHDVIVVYPDSFRTSASDIANIPVLSANTDASGRQARIPLSAVASVKPGTGPQQINRIELQRSVSISAGLLPGYAMGPVMDAVDLAIDSLQLPPGYSTTVGGDAKNLNETKGYVASALILAVIFIYLILASLFGSFFQPFSILMALPLSFIGVALALWATNGNLNIMSMIGIIMLMGLVVKNGILLIDFTNQARATGAPRTEAILSSARTRLRPIIMTTMAMIFGMLPLALALGGGAAEQRAPLARAVIGGLITSTLLTLFVVPVVYTVIEDGLAFTRHIVRDKILGLGRSSSRNRESRQTVSAP